MARTKISRYVKCVLDSDRNGSGDGGNCSGFHVACSSNLQAYCNEQFGTAVRGERIDDEDISAFYTAANTVANNRSFTSVSRPTNVDDNNIIDDNDYDVLKNWVDARSDFGNAETEDVGNSIDASGWISLRDRLKNIAKMCNQVFHADCPSVCSCNTVCTCNCNSNY